MTLYPHERFFLLRRRMGIGQDDMAAELGVQPWDVRRMERGTLPLLTSVQLPSPPTPGEQAAIFRRRKGWTMTEAARRLRVSRMTLWKAEHDLTSGVEAILDWYKRRDG